MDEYVKDILRKWELPELIPTFEEEEVNEKAFKCLTDDIIRELVPKLGKRAIFNKAYRAYREALDKQPDSSVVVKPNESVSLPGGECTSVVVISWKLLPEICRRMTHRRLSHKYRWKIPLNSNHKFQKKLLRKKFKVRNINS
nr:uncharacterized protein LOC115265275 isoform X2 [Aedes albopictus]XP_029725586.1 uncharacterized protein LOC115265275 isoform X2 [Aedes albopictus]